MSTIRRLLLFALPIFVVLTFLLDNQEIHRYVRRLAAHCVHNVYGTPTTILKIPPIPESSTGNIPSYLALCQEWIRHDAYYNDSNPYETWRIVEDESVCMDWSAPHLSMMEIFAALVVTSYIPRIKYRHNCDRTRTFDEGAYGFDYTTIQQVLNTPGVAVDQYWFSREEIKHRCRKCLVGYDPQIENVRVKAKAVHHCLLHPENPAANLDPFNLPLEPNKNKGYNAMSSIIPIIRNRLYHSAMEWRNVTDKPATEEGSGTVIWIDPTTVGVDYAVIANYIEIPATTVTILAGPLCATAFLPTGQVCHEYAEGLSNFLYRAHPWLQTSGPNGGRGVLFKVIASTAAAYSRMIHAGRLLCPPRTPTCYLPAVAKHKELHQEAIILEDPSWEKSIDFFTVTGTWNAVQVVVLDPSQIPDSYTTNPTRRAQIGVAAEFTHVNALVDDEGYPLDLARPLPSDADVAALTDQQILDDLAIAVKRFEDNPVAFRNRLEIVPTLEQVQKAIQANEKLSVNSLSGFEFPFNGNGNGGRALADHFRHGELATDGDFDFKVGSVGVEYWKEANQLRHDSLLRIQKTWETSFYGHAQDNGSIDPSTVVEINCPSETGNGGFITYTGGVVTTVNGDELVISDTGNGVVIKDAKTDAVIATGLTSVDSGTVFTSTTTGGFYIKEDGDTTAAITSEHTPAAAVSKRALKKHFKLKREHFTFDRDLERLCQRGNLQ